MTDSSSTWTTAQERERHYYETRAASHEGQDQVYAEFHAPFWTGILARLNELKFADDGVYVDVGCGPNPIVAFIDKGRRIGVDPLMPFYQENFKFPENFEAHQGTIEQLEPVRDGEADLIFSMNNIDHIQNLPQAAATLRRKLKDSGFLIVSVNIVGNPITSLIAKGDRCVSRHRPDTHLPLSFAPRGGRCPRAAFRTGPLRRYRIAVRRNADTQEAARQTGHDRAGRRPRRPEVRQERHPAA